MLAKRRAIFVCGFTLCIFIVFASTTIGFRIAGAGNVATTRIAVQAITCILCFGIYLFLRSKLNHPDSVSLPHASWRLPVWAAIGFGCSLLPYALVLQPRQLHWENLRVELLVVALVFPLSAAIFEEIYFRDMLFRWMLGRYGVALSMLVQIISFTALHFLTQPFSWVALLSFSVGATLFSFLWLLTKDMIAPLIAHFICNATTILFNGFFTTTIARAGLLYGETSIQQVYARIGFEAIAALLVGWLWLKQRSARLPVGL